MNRWKAFINISWSFMAKIVAIVFVFLTDIVIARTMSIEDYASWTYFFSIKTMMIYICDLGIKDCCFQKCEFCSARDNNKSLPASKNNFRNACFLFDNRIIRMVDKIFCQSQ